MDENKFQEAVTNPSNQGEMPDADVTGTVGSPECGDMVRMWIKFREGEDGRKVIDRATFQSFGCQTALAVASVATEMVAGKTVDEVLGMDAAELSGPLGSLPPMKIHCGQMVEGALRDALGADVDSGGDSGGAIAADVDSAPDGEAGSAADSLSDSFSAPSFPAGGRIRIVPLDGGEEES